MPGLTRVRAVSLSDRGVAATATIEESRPPDDPSKIDGKQLDQEPPQSAIVRRSWLVSSSMDILLGATRSQGDPHPPTPPPPPPPPRPSPPPPPPPPPTPPPPPPPPP